MLQTLGQRQIYLDVRSLKAATLYGLQFGIYLLQKSSFLFVCLFFRLEFLDVFFESFLLRVTEGNLSASLWGRHPESQVSMSLVSKILAFHIVSQSSEIPLSFLANILH